MESSPTSSNAAVSDLRNQVKNLLKSRAMLMAALLDELEPEIGLERAETVLRRVMHKRSEGAGKRFLSDCAPGNMPLLRERFIDFLPDHGGLFEIETTRCDAAGLGIKFKTCPVKEAYEEAGISPERMQVLLRISGDGDVGLFEGAGFAIRNDTWAPGGQGCCHLHIKPRD
ncbi:L-2-amino-thiazoline-4-carboxylic acid hydrolase [Ottowia sp. VDI28]|uniref:L-2-amino-thiazoline-4-carboxylic acid hydrolase n=1 Tax=Ottowia sp. VDI28 TaxID=3133968 RepID=UPI003C2DD169